MTRSFKRWQSSDTMHYSYIPTSFIQPPISRGPAWGDKAAYNSADPVAASTGPARLLYGLSGTTTTGTYGGQGLARWRAIGSITAWLTATIILSRHCLHTKRSRMAFPPPSEYKTLYDLPLLDEPKLSTKKQASLEFTEYSVSLYHLAINLNVDAKIFRTSRC